MLRWHTSRHGECGPSQTTQTFRASTSYNSCKDMKGHCSHLHAHARWRTMTSRREGMVGCTGSRRIGAGHTSQSTFPSHHQAIGKRSDGVVIYQPVRGDISGLGGMRAAAVGHSILLQQASRQRQSLRRRNSRRTRCCRCLLLQYLTQSCARGGRRIVEDMCYEIRRAEACVD